MPISTKTRRRMTEEDLKALRDDGHKYELVNGRIRTVPTGGRHGWLEAKLMSLLAPRFLHEKPLFGSSTGFRMVGGNVRSPDLAVMERARLPEGKIPIDFIDGAPDLAIEIISPTERPQEVHEKLREYFDSGAQEVWLIFPDKKELHRYTGLLEVQVLREHETLTTPLLPGFQLPIAELFEE
ncbi:MAG: hypothetical protein C4337_08435 [Armatimonadota bacterium]